jgi:hypothetical protein
MIDMLMFRLLGTTKAFNLIARMSLLSFKVVVRAAVFNTN